MSWIFQSIARFYLVLRYFPHMLIRILLRLSLLRVYWVWMMVVLVVVVMLQWWWWWWWWWQRWWW